MGLMRHKHRRPQYVLLSTVTTSVTWFRRNAETPLDDVALTGLISRVLGALEGPLSEIAEMQSGRQVLQQWTLPVLLLLVLAVLLLVPLPAAGFELWCRLRRCRRGPAGSGTATLG